MPIASHFCSNKGDVLRAAAVKGNGITNLPTFIVGEDIKAGRLRIVLPNRAPTSLTIYALYAPNRYLAAKTRLLIDFLVARFGNGPSWDGYLGLDQADCLSGVATLRLSSHLRIVAGMRDKLC